MNSFKLYFFLQISLVLLLLLSTVTVRRNCSLNNVGLVLFVFDYVGRIEWWGGKVLVD